MDGFKKEDLLRRLERLDEDADLLFDDDCRFRMVIVGGNRLEAAGALGDRCGRGKGFRIESLPLRRIFR